MACFTSSAEAQGRTSTSISIRPWNTALPYLPHTRFPPLSPAAEMPPLARPGPAPRISGTGATARALSSECSRGAPATGLHARSPPCASIGDSSPAPSARHADPQVEMRIAAADRRVCSPYVLIKSYATGLLVKPPSFRFAPGPRRGRVPCLSGGGFSLDGRVAARHRSAIRTGRGAVPRPRRPAARL
jgi:hypothetical protein